MAKAILYLCLLLLLLPCVLAQEPVLNTTITPEEKAAFDQMLTPVTKIYNFTKYVSTLIAAVFLLYAGISYMMSGGEPFKRERAKNIAVYVVVGLLIIWATPFFITFLV